MESYRLIAATETAVTDMESASAEIAAGTIPVSCGLAQSNNTRPAVKSNPPNIDDIITPVSELLIVDHESDEPTFTEVTMRVIINVKALNPDMIAPIRKYLFEVGAVTAVVGPAVGVIADIL
jgi:hypothetical protein